MDIEGIYEVRPGGGVRWKFAPQWTLNAVLPKPRLEFGMNKDITLYAGVEVKASNYRVDGHFGDERVIAKLINAVLSSSDVNKGVGLKCKFSPLDESTN